MWWMLFPRWIWFCLGHVCVLLLHLRVRAMTVSKVVYSHAGMCPNEMNPNLWVDAMSTCMRECQSDQVRMVSVARASRLLYVVLNCSVRSLCRQNLIFSLNTMCFNIICSHDFLYYFFFPYCFLLLKFALNQQVDKLFIFHKPTETK